MKGPMLVLVIVAAVATWEVGSPLTIREHPGAFGWPWMEKVTELPKP